MSTAVAVRSTLSHLAFADISDDETKRMLDMFYDGPARIAADGNFIVCVLWARPEKTKGGVIITQAARDEEIWQGKNSLIVSIGPDCFQDNVYRCFTGVRARVGDWIVTDPMAGKKLQVNKAFVRIIVDDQILARTNGPQAIL